MRKMLGIGVGLAVVIVGLSSAPSFAVVGAKCGGFAPIACGPHEFCEHPPGTCFVPDLEGTCAHVPFVCPLAKKASIVLPVCGCNGKTYGNDCERERAKVSKAHDGACLESH